MRAVVVTSIDPAVGRISQMRALQAWHDVGAQALSVNTPRDAALLRLKGLSEEHCLELSPRQTWLDATGRATPLIEPLLRHMAQTVPDQALVITAPGVYPAISDAPSCIHHWLSRSPALALTVESTPLLEMHRFSTSTPRRSDLAAFVLAPDRILPLADHLAQWPLVDEMCLGDLGWDLLLGAVIAEPDFGGLIADSAVLLAESTQMPRDNSTDLHGLSPYIKPLRQTGLGEAPGATDMIEECTDSITTACDAQKALSAEIKAFHFDPILPPDDLPDHCTARAQSLQYMIPWVRWNYDLQTLALLARRIEQDPPLAFAHSCDALCTGPNLVHQRSEALLATLLHLQSAKTRPKLRDSYKTPAQTEQHVAALHRLTTSDPELTNTATQLQLVRLWGAQVVDLHVSNPRLQDAVALLCQNNNDRALFDAITQHNQELSDAA